MANEQKIRGSFNSLKRPQMLAIIQAGLGIALLLGGAERFSNSSFEVLRAIGPWWVWGIVMCVTGTAVLACWPKIEQRPKLAIVSMAGGSTVMFLWAIAFLAAVPRNETAAATAPWMYGFLAVMHLGVMWDLMKEHLL